MGRRVEIDEMWFSEYVEFGWSELLAYLAKWAKFIQLFPEPEEEESK